MLHEIKAFVRPELTDSIVHGLESIGVRSMTITAVEALGSLADQTRSHLSLRYIKAYCRVCKIEIVCRDADSDRIVGLIQRLAHTGDSGDGIIFVSPVVRAVKVRSGAKDEEALDPLLPDQRPSELGDET